MAAKKIGIYFVESQTCDQQVIEVALERQTKLENEGIYRPIGRILIENGDLTPEELELVLRRQGEELLRSVELFKSLPPQFIPKIAGVAEFQTFPRGKIIIHEGDQGNSFFQIISGSIRVFRISEDGIDVTLNTFGPGESFGEMALLTGEPRSASVETREATGLLVISKQAFDRLAAEIPEFSLVLSKILSSRLHKGTSSLVRASVTEKAYQRFVAEQSFGFNVKLVGRSKAFKRLRDRVKETAGNDRSVLILGESGTEKADVSKMIHDAGKRKEGPFLTVDIKTVIMGRRTGQSGEHDPIRFEIAQNSALFGHAKGALSFAPEKRLGLFQVGDGGTVLLENIEHLAHSVQQQLVDFMQQGCFRTMGDPTPVHASARIMATSSVDLEQLVQDGRFSELLFDLLGGNQPLVVPPLRNRKKDLRQLTEHLLEHYSRQAGKSVKGIDLDVYKSIMAYEWPGNTDELKAVIRRAVNLAQNSRLTPEDILIGTAPHFTDRLTFNLLKVDRIRSLFQSNAFPNAAQWVAALFFVLIVCLGFFGNGKSGSNVSLELTWGIWEPLVVLGCLLVGRIWCAVCPIGALSSFISRKFGLKRSVPSFIRNYGVYLAGAGLGLIFWSEVAFNMLTSPRATAILILSITVPAVMLALVYQRRLWCRFLCPLGKLVGFLSRCSPLELRANYNICNNDCREHNCYVGSDNQAGCPVFEAPFVLHSNQECILCGNCIKNCPNQSPVINLRVPGRELWTFSKPDSTMALFVPIVMGAQIFRGLEKTAYFHSYAVVMNQQWIFYSVFIFLTTFLAFLFARTAGDTVFDSVKAISGEKSNLMVYAFAPLVVFFELGFHFERLINLGGRLVPMLGRQLGFNWGFLTVNMGPGLIKVFQVFFILVGFFVSSAVLIRLLRSCQSISSKHLSLRQRWPILLLAAVYIWIFWSPVIISQ